MFFAGFMKLCRAEILGNAVHQQVELRGFFFKVIQFILIFNQTRFFFNKCSPLQPNTTTTNLFFEKCSNAPAISNLKSQS